MKKLLVVMLVSVLAWSMGSVYAQKPGVVLSNDPGWQKIGETVASFKLQNESISVLGADEFAAIKIKVDAPLHIERLQVFYESGEMEEIDVKKRIQAGDESGVFKLKHPDRDIQKVAFTYNTVPNAQGEKADVELYGFKTGNEPSESYRDEKERAEEKAERAEKKLERAEEKGERKAEADIERKADEAEDELEENADESESDLERAAEKTGDAISETAGKAAAEIDDARHDTKVGPDGQTVYVSDDSRYYYVNEKGKRIYVTELQLKDKQEKD
ncbi:MAG: hypothetical protein WD824_08480 [Cyclobacteriaceae bacterium]